MIVNITEAREALGAFCHDTYFTWSAFKACGFHSVSGRYRPLQDFLRAFARARDESPPAPVVHFRAAVPRGSVSLSAVYGPSGWDGAYVILMLPEEPRRPAPRFPLGRVSFSKDAAEVLDPEVTNGALGRHVAGLWSDRAKYGEGREMEEALQEGREVRSFHDLPSVGELYVWVTTNPARTETVVEMAR
jgi:hypothetical protein